MGRKELIENFELIELEKVVIDTHLKKCPECIVDDCLIKWKFLKNKIELQEQQIEILKQLNQMKFDVKVGIRK